MNQTEILTNLTHVRPLQPHPDHVVVAAIGWRRDQGHQRKEFVYNNTRHGDGGVLFQTFRSILTDNIQDMSLCFRWLGVYLALVVALVDWFGRGSSS